MNVSWNSIEGYSDITYAKKDGVARIAFNRPSAGDAFRPKAVAELLKAFYDAQEDNSIEGSFTLWGRSVS